MCFSPLCGSFFLLYVVYGGEGVARANENLKALSNEMPATTENGGHSFKSGST